MGNSTITVQNVFDRVAAKGIPTPLSQPAGYGIDLAVAMANDVLNEMLAERFNPKWNRAIAAPFYTNSFQQDYPQVGLTTVAWLENADRIDINNTATPKPLKQMTVRRDIARTSLPWGPTINLSWDYNANLSWGTWPGANTVYSPLVTAAVKQNPIMNFIDKNGNYLVLTTFGTTGATAPFAAANAAEGTTVNDGTCVWTVAAGTSQGYRVDPLPGASGPVWQIVPYYQKRYSPFATLGSLINPIPDDYSRYFQSGLEIYCKRSTPDPQMKKEAAAELSLWLKDLADMNKQGGREIDAFALLPSTSPVENIYAWVRNPQDPSQPY